MSAVILTEEERAQIESNLAEAEAAYHTYRMGGAARTFVDQNGERVEFTVVNASRLQAYIFEMKAQLGKPTGIVGPLNVWSL